MIAATATRPRVLLVEDETTIAEPLVEALEREGFDVDVAPTGHAALDAGDTDIILLDLGLPDIDGSSLLAAFAATPATRDVPVIVATARDLTETEREQLQARAFAVLAKSELTAALVPAMRAATGVAVSGERT